MKCLNIALVTLFLCACGGGGGGSAAPETPVVPETPADPSTPDTPAVPQTTADLVASPQMDFASCGEVLVNVSVESGRSAFVALYAGFESAGDRYQPDYQNRLAAGVTEASRFQATLMAADEQRQLLVEVWYQGETAPLQQVFALPSERIDWAL